MDEDEWWRFVIDGNRHLLGPYQFDVEEPGYLEAVLLAFKYIRLNFSRLTLTSSLLIDLHRRATHLTNINSGIRYKSVTFGLTQDTTTVDGLKELYEYWINNFSILFASERNKHKAILSLQTLTIKYAKNELIYYISRISPDKIITQLKLIIDTYHVDIQQTDQYSVFYAIMKCAHHIDLVHPFSDGNIRTCWLLINLLLMQNNYNPVILDDPNKLDGHSTAELVLWLDKCMINTAALFNWEYTPLQATTIKSAKPPFENNLAARIKRKHADLEVDDIIHKRRKLNDTPPIS